MRPPILLGRGTATTHRVAKNTFALSHEAIMTSRLDFGNHATMSFLTNAALLRYVDSMRTHSHRAAKIDPLDLIHREEVAALSPERYGLTDDEQRYNVNGILWTKSVGEPGKERSALPKPDDAPLKRRIHGLLARSEVFDNFLQLKFPNLKRYGLEGGESMLPALDSLFAAAAQAGVQHVMLGGFEIPEELGAEGDVLSHLGLPPAEPVSSWCGLSPASQCTCLICEQFSEAVNPVAMGKTRAKQYSLLKTSPDDCKLGDKAMCVQIHGDASFAGQGVVMESLGLSNLPHFTSGGSVHLVVDIGYTTPASNARSSLYCSDVGKMINAPVLHVNGDYPEDVAKAMNIAFRYRNYFRKDIIVDLHNELDLPGITSPLMYSKIAARKSVPQLYEHKLIAEDILTPEDINTVRSAYKGHLESELAKVPSYAPSASMLEGQWKGMVWPASAEAVHDPVTGVDVDILKDIGRASVKVPEGFEIHPKLHRHVKNRLQSIESGKGLDFATAEALAFGSLMLEGNDIRISGQDVGRGTFSHRHAMLVNQRTEGVIVPLNDELKADGKLELANRLFEYGASWERPNLLPIWEAQFGDFFNGAQVIIDTFITSAETKWLKQSGIVLMLPHGLDGAGPEHSSSRLERMLQLTNDRPHHKSEPNNINMHVVYPTTPRNTSIWLLRLAAASSSLSDISDGTRFQPVLADPFQNEESARRIVLLSGKLYYDLVKEREARSLNDEIAFVRIEELSPFPFAALEKVVWVQEEPEIKALCTCQREDRDMLEDGQLKYIGRKESAVPAPGVGRLYQAQQKAVIDQVFDL
ncbi:dehydrogenase E1 and transketolase domain-containing protein 1 [Pholiota molesta]|nr:dehydrogenase E1 and transketolase domain-containing protein 1 [Pholiota molesta]